MKFLIASGALRPAELFDLVVQQGVTAIIDLRRQAVSAPATLRHIYRRPVMTLAAHFMERFIQSWTCDAHLPCTADRAPHCRCRVVMLILIDAERAAEVRQQVLRIKPFADVGEMQAAGDE